MSSSNSLSRRHVEPADDGGRLAAVPLSQLHHQRVGKAEDGVTITVPLDELVPANGGAPVVGAAITFIDATGATGDMRSGTNGNFWWGLPVSFPVTLIASACPTIDRMTATIPSGQGGCNRTGCHTAGGGAGRIHLP